MSLLGIQAGLDSLRDIPAIPNTTGTPQYPLAKFLKKGPQASRLKATLGLRAKVARQPLCKGRVQTRFRGTLACESHGLIFKTPVSAGEGCREMSERRIKVTLPPIRLSRWESVSASDLIEAIQERVSAVPADMQEEVRLELGYEDDDGLVSTEIECWYCRCETAEEIAERDAKEVHAKKRRAEIELAELRRLKAKYPSE